MAFEDTYVHKVIRERPIKFLSPKSVQWGSSSSTEHIDQHWKPDMLGSFFIPNPYFDDQQSMLLRLDGIMKNQLKPEYFHIPQRVTVKFDSNIGVDGIVETHDGDRVYQLIRGKRTVNVIDVDGPLPETPFLSFQARPIFPRKGEKGNISFVITHAYPGLHVPKNDKKFWQNHAFARPKTPYQILTSRLQNSRAF